MSWQEYLEELKEKPVADDFVLDVPTRKLAKAIRSWAMSDVKIVPHKESFPEDSDDKDKFDWLWSSASFNLKKWLNLVGFDLAYGMFFRLVFAGLIYPDGTYNEEWIQRKLLEQKRRNKNDRNGEFEGDDD